VVHQVVKEDLLLVRAALLVPQEVHHQDKVVLQAASEALHQVTLAALQEVREALLKDIQVRGKVHPQDIHNTVDLPHRIEVLLLPARTTYLAIRIL